MSSFDDIGNLYVEMILEKGGGSHGDKKAIMNMLKDAMKRGLVDLDEKKSGYMVKSLVDGSQLLIHKGEGSLHPLRRYLLGLSKIAA